MKINEKPGTQRELARKVLIWTAYARRLLSIRTLTYALSIERDTQSLEDLESSIPTQKNILDACANLISIDQGYPQYARFVHFSVQEFLTCGQSTYIDSLGIGREVAHREIAQSCMITLTLLPPQTFPSEHEWPHSPPSKLWHRYAFNEWPHHLLAGDLNSQQVDDQIVTLALSFFDTGPLVLINLHPPMTYPPWCLKKAYPLKFSPPVLALIFDLPDAPKCRPSHKILSDDKLAMHYAAELDSVTVARRLYNYGLPGNYTYCRENSRVPEGLKETPLLYSVQSGRMARFLLDNNITSMEVGALHLDPLLFFTRKRNFGAEVLQVLVGRLGVVDQNRESFGHVLRFAANIGNLDAIRLLLNKGVDINSLDESDGSALQIAILNEMVEVIWLLLDKGADVNIKGGKYGCVLQAAAIKGSIKVIQLLLDKGADVNIKGGFYGCALQAAASTGSIKVVQLLLDKGADVNVKGGKYGNVLQAAAWSCCNGIEAIRLLLDNGADVHAQGGIYGTALQAALAPNEEKRDAAIIILSAVQLLLDYGADSSTYVPESEFGDALTAARRLWKDDDDRNHLDTAIELLAPGGLKTDLALRERKRNLSPQGKRDEAESNENSLEDPQESKRRRI